MHGAHRDVLDDGTFDVAEHLGVGFALVVVRVDIDDKEVLILALMRLPRGVREVLMGVVLIEAEVADLVLGRHIHGNSPV